MTTAIDQLAADIFARTITAAEAGAVDVIVDGEVVATKAEMVWRTMRAWDVGGIIGAEHGLIGERFSCSEAEWICDHDRFSGVREELHEAVGAIHGAWVVANDPLAGDPLAQAERATQEREYE
ncbi:MAG: hypothetical protein MUE69_33850 [Myxococcota bacterium]|jgi:hypothetical protein|nr:hypothetical protein [Myxococcota bacterium]